MIVLLDGDVLYTCLQKHQKLFKNIHDILPEQAMLNQSLIAPQSANLMSSQPILLTESYVVYTRFAVFIVCLFLWLKLWAKKTDLGKDVFGYRGDDKWLKLRRQIAICSWWWQSSLILLSLTWHNNLVIDSLTIFATLTFGGPWFHTFPKMRSLFGLKHSGWDYVFSLLELSHHISISYIILFESDRNKLLYRPIFVWLWLCHSLSQFLRAFPIITSYISWDSIWTLYWKMGPYLFGYWYIFDFMQSDNAFLSIGLQMLLFGRWSLSYNWPADANWPRAEKWQDETLRCMIHLGLAHLYYHSARVSWTMAVAYAAFVWCLQQIQPAKASTTT